MKTKILTLSAVALFISNLLIAQPLQNLDPFTNSYYTPGTPALHTQQPYGSRGGGSLPPCSDSTFWAININGGIEEFILRDTIADAVNIYYNGVPGYNLALANLNGENAAPTFYAYYLDTVYHFDGTNWVAGSGTCEMLANLGGYGNYLYSMDNVNGTYLNSIIRYNGTSFDTILNGGSTTFTGADLAVDEVGNIWCMRRNNDSLYIDVISPQGSLLKRFNVQSFNTISSYGCFLLNDKFYLGIGMQNPDYSSVLIPFTISDDTAIMEAPITMSLIEYIDLASCNPGNPLKLSPTGIASATPAPASISIFPNPAVQSQTVTIKSNVALTKITLRDMAGRIVKQIEEQNAAEVTVNTQGFAKGLYLVETYTGSERPALIQKLVIE